MGHIQEIIQDAKQWIGTEEIQPNLGFKNAAFQAKMNKVGFYRSASWCGFFVMLVLFDTYADAINILTYLKKYCSPSTHQMWLNFKASKEVITGQIPKLGAVIIWHEGDGTNGHTGIVSWVAEDGKTFKSIEGNTNGAGGREGYRVWENTHTVGLLHSEKGLNISGFAYMVD
jgi:hypothetical protein